MTRFFAAFFFAAAALLGPSSAQEAESVAPSVEPSALQEIMTKDYPQETLDLAMQLVKVSGTGRTFDELLPNIADQAKNAFIRANPQMQLGIIGVVDRAAMELVSRRRELDQMLARVWASGFTDEEMRELIAFYSSDTGNKFARQHAKLLGVEMAAAERWGQAVSAELTQRVSDELRAAMDAEQKALQGDIAGPASETPAPAQ